MPMRSIPIVGIDENPGCMRENNPSATKNVTHVLMPYLMPESKLNTRNDNAIEKGIIIAVRIMAEAIPPSITDRACVKAVYDKK